MRVVWKDTNIRKYTETRYRGYTVTPLEDKGWIIDMKGDDKIYSSRFSAMNAIDKYLGGSGQRGDAKRKELGIKVIGKKSETA